MALFRAIAWYTWGLSKFTKSGYESAAKDFHPKDLEVNLTDKHYVVTGANSGLGFQTSKFLASRGATVHMLCRDPERGRKAHEEIKSATGNEQVHLHIVDVSRMADIRRFAAEYEETYPRLDCLINNAGVMLETRQTTPEGLEATFATNTMAPFLLTNLLLPVLKRSAPSRVIIVSSGGMYNVALDADDLQFQKMKKWDGTMAYAHTKRAEVEMTDRFAELHKDSGVFFYSMHPGWSGTAGVQQSMPDFYEKNKHNLRSDAEGADTICWLAVKDGLTSNENNGQFFFDRQIAKKHMTMAFTSVNRSKVDKMWAELTRIAGL